MSAELIEQLILITHLLLALAIIGLIMLQQGKGADMGASFGAGASQTLFGSSGSGNVLTRATAWMVALFFATSFGLAVIAKNKTAAVDDFDLPLPAAEQQPAVEDDLPAVDAADDAAMGEIPEVMAPSGSDEASAEMGDLTGDEPPELE
jgi:preprotein translocase subunit SecG